VPAKASIDCSRDAHDTSHGCWLCRCRGQALNAPECLRLLKCRTSSVAKVDHRTEFRLHYHSDYYGAFVLDPDGHRIEAVCHAPTRPTIVATG
jgi:hypothetical protein